MSQFSVHTIDTAPEAATPILAGAAKAYGFLPNLLGVMAEAPPLLEGYMSLFEIFEKKTDLSPTEQQIVLMVNNRLNGCTYCMAAHTSIAQMQKIPADVIEALRDGSPLADSKLEALRVFAVKVNEDRGWVESADIEALVEAGYTTATAFEVILGTAVKVLSNYTNHIAETPVDAAFAPNAWSRPEAAAV